LVSVGDGVHVAVGGSGVRVGVLLGKGVKLAVGVKVSVGVKLGVGLGGTKNVGVIVGVRVWVAVIEGVSVGAGKVGVAVLWVGSGVGVRLPGARRMAMIPAQ
jgi:hypothetical protein